LNVSDAPAASVLLDQVNVHTFEVVLADVPLPLRGLSEAPEGTVSFVQWSPLGTENLTAKPVTLAAPLFLTVIVPQ
jgi:hypothetical protein